MVTKFSQSIKSICLITMVSSLALMNAVSAGGGPWKQALKEQEDIEALTQRCIRGIKKIDEGTAPTSEEFAERTLKKQRWEARLKKCMSLREKPLLEPQDYLDIALVDQEFLPRTVILTPSFTPEPVNPLAAAKVLEPDDIPEETVISSHRSSIARFGAERNELSEFLSKKDYAGAFNNTKANTDASEEGIVKFLLSSNGYGKWEDLLPETQKWVVAEVKDAAQRKELEEFLGKKNYPGAFKATKATLPPTVSDEEIVKFLLSSNGYGKWEDLLPGTQKWVVAKVKDAAQRNELEEFLGKNDFSGAFKKMRESTDASEEEIVKFLLSSNGYEKWANLLSETQKWVIAKVKKEKDAAPNLLTVVYGGRSEERVSHNIETEVARAGESIKNFLKGKGFKHNKKLKKKKRKKDK